MPAALSAPTLPVLVDAGKAMASPNKKQKTEGSFQSELGCASREAPVSDWERQMQKRIDILAVLKCTPAYQAFNKERPREERNKHLEPMTPDPMEPSSKRNWEKRFRTFKSRVNEWHDEFRRTTRSPEAEKEEQTGSSKWQGPQEFRCDDPRHYALSVCCPHAGLHCSCQESSPYYKHLDPCE